MDSTLLFKVAPHLNFVSSSTCNLKDAVTIVLYSLFLLFLVCCFGTVIKSSMGLILQSSHTTPTIQAGTNNQLHSQQRKGVAAPSCKSSMWNSSIGMSSWWEGSRPSETGVWVPIVSWENQLYSLRRSAYVKFTFTFWEAVSSCESFLETEIFSSTVHLVCIMHIVAYGRCSELLLASTL